MTYSVLWIDDEPYRNSAVAQVLEILEFKLTRCSTTLEAVRAYNADHYDIIIVDRMMPPGMVFNGSITEEALDTGRAIVQDLRSRPHLQLIPIVVYTQFTVQDVDVLRHFGRIQVVSKDTVGTEFAQILTDMIIQYPVKRVAVEVADEYPDAAPYYALDMHSKQPVRLYFDPCSKDPEARFVAASPYGQWELGTLFATYLRDEASAPALRKCESRQPGGRTGLHGLYFAGGNSDPENWKSDVRFETAPWNRAGAQAQQLKGVGKVLAVRFLRECIVRSGGSVREIVKRIDYLDWSLTFVNPDPTCRAALKILHFTEVANQPGVMALEAEIARRLIVEVTLALGIRP